MNGATDMAKSGEELVRDIQRDLECPQCEYNLRGLRGHVVSCPECGETCDVAKLIILRWTTPWYRVPGLSIVFMPTAWVAIGLIVVPLLIFRLHFDETALTGYALILLTGWVWLMSRAWHLFQSAEGIYLALASHVVLAGYILGLVGVLGGVIRAFTPSGDLLFKVAWALIAVALALVFWQCRKAEEFIGKRCLRRYLINQVGHD